MTTYIIGYDLNRPGQDYKILEDAIKALGNWWHCLDSTWIVKTNRSAVDIRDTLQSHIDANQNYLTTGLTIIELASNLHTGFAERPPAERQEILKLLLDNATWEKDRLTIEFREPWKSLQTTRTTLAPPNTGLAAITKEWPARPDSNRGPSA